MALSKEAQTGFLESILGSASQHKALTAASAAFAATTLYLLRDNLKSANQAVHPLGSKGKKKKKKRTLVNKAFFKKVRQLINICIPGWKSTEALQLVIFSLFLLARTYLSIKLADVNGMVVKSIIEVNFRQFIKGIVITSLFALPSSVVNSMLTFLQETLALRFRSRLVKHFNELYLAPLMYYKLNNIDSRFSKEQDTATVDQVLTQTFDDWSRELSSLYSEVTKPVLDIALFSVRLAQLLGPAGPLSAVVYYMFTAVAFRYLSPPIGRITARASELESQFRNLHKRIIHRAEEIAFYAGHKKEKDTLNKSYANIDHHQSYLIDKEFYTAIFHGFLTKYGSFLLAYSILGLPVFGPQSSQYLAQIGGDKAQITGDYIRNSSLYVNLAKAIGKIVVSYGKIQRLAGFTSLVSDLQDVLGDLQSGRYVREMSNPKLLQTKNLAPGNGELVEVEKTGVIEFKQLAVVTPNGDVLVENINMKIPNGMNLMITGPNGCGKSSLFRILGGLWPIFGGTVKKPQFTDMFYIPQKPYLTIGTLRDQVIYPHTYEQFSRKSNDDELLKLLTLAQCPHIVGREGGWDQVNDWSEVLSGGEKQQIAMARLIYHKPQFAIMDECTSEISVKLEGLLYTHCKSIGINIITVSHRPSLWAYHDHLLKFDGRGGWEFGEMVLPEGYQRGAA